MHNLAEPEKTDAVCRWKGAGCTEASNLAGVLQCIRSAIGTAQGGLVSFSLPLPARRRQKRRAKERRT